MTNSPDPDPNVRQRLAAMAAVHRARQAELAVPPPRLIQINAEPNDHEFHVNATVHLRAHRTCLCWRHVYKF